MPEIEVLSSGRLRVRFEEGGARLLRELLEGLESSLDHRLPEDPAMARLFPAASADEDEARAFDALVGEELHRTKLEDLRALQTALGDEEHPELVLDRQETDRMLRVLNDVRLTIGARIDVTEEDLGRELDEDDPRSGPIWLLDWLAWTQAMLLEHHKEEVME